MYWADSQELLFGGAGGLLSGIMSERMRGILAIDQGTTGSTVLILNENLERLSEASVDFEQHFPQPGWVEHDLDQVWGSVQSAVKLALARVPGIEIICIGITNQRETVCFWERETARPLARAIVWQDRRTAEMCEGLKARGVEPFYQDKTGLLLDPYFSGTKVAWALKNWGDVKTAAAEGRLAVGTIDSFLIAKLTGGAAHVTEPSNASRTLCFDIHKRKFDAELCQGLGVGLELWPEVRASNAVFGHTRSVAGLKDGIPITGCLGDQQAALLGQACIQEGMAKCTYGTGAFLLLNTGTKPAKSRHRLLSTVAWQFKDQAAVYALEGSVFVAGSAVQWVRDGLGMIRESSEIEALAGTVATSDGVVFVPSLTGLGAPYWNPSATGMLTGLTRGTRRGHIARAVLEGIAFQCVDVLQAMQKDLGKTLSCVHVDGGAAANALLMQFQADVLGVQLKRPKYLETTALGAVFAAGLGAGVWTELKQIEQTWQQEREFTPAIEAKEREEHLARWRIAVARVQGKAI